MTNPIPLWKTEHGNFARLLELLQGTLVTPAEDAAPEYALVLDVLHYLTNYPDRFHHPVEDELYALLRDRRPDLGPTVDRLHCMHRRIATDGRGLLELVQGVSCGMIVPRRLLARRAWAYVTRYRRHMHLEEGLLLPAALQEIPATAWRSLRRHRPDDPLFGRAIADEFRRLHAAIASGAGCGCATA
ncbi:MAG TPA: hemerythrin domain-containing protein [Gammaproteobacteria bacterium]|nr:hemerythrin domain-containing protein [Gammaproteobacteria bacterium]